MRLAIGSLLICGAWFVAASATTIRVPEDYLLIQQACNSAVSGDTILLGTLRDTAFVEAVSLTGKPLVFKSALGPQRTQIRRRFIIDNLLSTDTTRFLGIRWNTGSIGVPLVFDNGTFVVDGCVFDTSNYCASDGCAIAGGSKCDVLVTRCTINAQAWGVRSAYLSSIWLSSCIFSRICNVAIDPQAGYVSVKYCCFSDNGTDADSSVDWGAGNMPFDPLLRVPDLALSPGSPCIDAGDPSLPLDPDGSLPDIGAYVPFREARTLYASPAGTDDSGNGTLAQPFRSIGMAYFCSVQEDTILLLPGVYSEHVRLERTNVQLSSTGGADVTFLERAVPNRHIIDFQPGVRNRSTISHLTIRNAVNACGAYVSEYNRPRFEYCTFAGNTPNVGGGLYINSDSVTVYGCLFENNTSASRGGGLLVAGGLRTIIDSCEFHDNRSGGAGSAVVLVTGCHYSTISRNLVYKNTYNDNLGGPVYLESSSGATVQNNTVVENYSSNFDAPGAGITLVNCSQIDLRNNLVAFNQGQYGIAVLGSPSSGITCQYNDVFSQWVGNYAGTSAGTGSISADPHCDQNYELLPGSPCIDAGDPATLVPVGGGSRIDMGALEYPHSVSVPASADEGRAGSFMLAPNYPNPFNASTRIAYSLSEPATVTLKIYDVMGRLVRSLVDEAQGAGEHTEIWNGRDERGQEVGSGVYFSRLSLGSEVAIRKMVVLK